MPSFLLSLSAMDSGEGAVLSALGGGEEMAEPEQVESITRRSEFKQVT